MRKNVFIIMLFCFPVFSFSQTTDTLIQKAESINCDGVTKTVDEFTGEKTFEFHIDADDGSIVSFSKIINKGVTAYYLSIWIKESGIYTGTGVNLILKNGKKINKPNEKVDYSYAGSSFYTTTFIRLTSADIALLKQSGIEKYKLYISTGQISDKSDISKDLFNCLLKAK
ncbi:MAG: hypothetical protein NT175_08705 [Bacteroidetes bacterium]|nr:hypothetical protein [Bacteroidota bacterium]